MKMKKILGITLILAIVLALFNPFVLAAENEVKENTDTIEESDTKDSEEKKEDVSSVGATGESDNESDDEEVGALGDDGVFGDFSKATVKLVAENDFKRYYLTIENATFVQGNSYYVLVTHKKEDTSYVKEGLKSEDLTAKGYTGISESYPKIDITGQVEENGDIYYTIVERGHNGEGEYGFKVVKEGALERLPLNSVGNRIKCYFFNDKTSTFLYEFAQKSKTSRKIKLKIGTVTDNNILINIRDGKANALNDLLTYAKSSSSPMYTGTVPLGDGASITNDMNLTNKAYYYVYMQMDDENGKYYPIEDVSLYQAVVGASTGKNLFDYLNSNFKWELANGGGNVITNPTDPTVAPTVYPRTGAIVLSVAGIVLIGTCIFFFKKIMKYREI